MRKYIIHYDTSEEVNQCFEIEADSPADADDAFYYEVASEVEVTEKYIEEVTT